MAIIWYWLFFSFSFLCPLVNASNLTLSSMHPCDTLCQEPQLDSCVCKVSITPAGKTCTVILLCISALTENGVNSNYKCKAFKSAQHNVYCMSSQRAAGSFLLKFIFEVKRLTGIMKLADSGSPKDEGTFTL